MTYKRIKSIGALYGLVFGILTFGFTIWGIGYSLDESDKVLKILLYIPTYLLMVIYIYLILGAFRLNYTVNDDNFVLTWGVAKKHIPWEDFDEIIEIKGHGNLFPFLAMAWPGYIVGLYQLKGIGPVRMYGTHAIDGFLYIKTKRGFLGLTPRDGALAQAISEKTGKEIKVINMDEIPVEEKGKDMRDDRFFKLYNRLNVIFLVILGLYVGIFFPGSGAPKIIILLLVLAMDLFFFNLANAKRLYQFSPQGGYSTLILGLAVTGIFFILALSEISL